MILPEKQDSLHKAWLYRLLAAIYDDRFLAGALCFKGGTCAAMRGILDRFSVDLDFDLIIPDSRIPEVRNALESIFTTLGLTIKAGSRIVPQYYLKYPNRAMEGRNSVKIDITTDPPKANRVESVSLSEIDRIVACQTIDTMFANKLVALIDRYELRGAIAGRDLYDIHYYFLQGFTYNRAVIQERRKNDDIPFFLKQLIHFIEEKITETVINQDLNVLLPYKTFNAIRKTLKSETILLLKEELMRTE